MNDLHLSHEARIDLAGIKAYIAEDLENPQAALSADGSKYKRSLVPPGSTRE